MMISPIYQQGVFPNQGIPLNFINTVVEKADLLKNMLDLECHNTQYLY
jgi:hypothetical protein